MDKMKRGGSTGRILVRKEYVSGEVEREGWERK